MAGSDSKLTATNSRVPEFDGIRGMAILLVLVWHCINNLIVNKTTPFNRLLLLITDRTWSGVDLFFVLSGFLLGTVLIKNRESKNYFRAFYLRRICRIFPLYYSFLLIYYLLWHTSLLQTMPWVFKNTLPFWAYICFTQNFFLAKFYMMSSSGLGHSYSLAIEEQFYLLLPAIVFFLRGKKLLLFIAVGFFAAFYFRITAANWIAAFALPYCRADALVMGLFTAHLTTNSTATQWMKKNIKWLYGSMYLMVLLIAAGGLELIPVNYYAGSSVNTILFTLLLLLVCTDKESKMVTFFRNRVLQRFGRLSFGIYIYHKLILGVVFYLLLHHAPAIDSFISLLVSLLGITITYFTAMLSYHSFEKRIIEWGHRFKYS